MRASGASTVRHSVLRALAWHAVAQLLCLVALVFTFRLTQADLSIPLVELHNDAVFSGVVVKAVQDTGWGNSTPYLGAPFGLELYDFPVLDPFQVLMVKIVLAFTGQWITALNVYYLVTFHLTVLMALLALRQLRLGYPVALVCSLLFAFAPFHLQRSIFHLTFSEYCFVPAAVVLGVWLIQCNSILVGPGRKDLLDGPAVIPAPNRRLVLLAAAAVGLSGVYYAFFGTCLIATGALVGAARQRSWRPLLSGVLIIAAATAVMLASFTPHLIYWFRNGFNAAPASNRIPAGAEIYGLKIIQLLLPVPGHRLGLLSGLLDRYTATAPLVNENGFAALGSIGAIGFLLLLTAVFVRGRSRALYNIIESLGLLNLMAVLLATIGGLGTLINYTLSNPVRCYNRISIMIAFMALAAVGLVLQWLIDRRPNNPAGRLVWGAALAMVLLAGLADQISPNFMPDHAALKAAFQNDEQRQFTGRVEALLPRGAMVYQLPAIAYPWLGEGQNNMAPLEHWRCYLFSSALHLSGGPMDGRFGAEWQRSIEGLPLRERLTRLVQAGFDGLWIDCAAYSDRGAALLAEVKAVLGNDPMTSPTGHFSFFSLRELRQTLAAGASPAELARQHDDALNIPLAVYWGTGFYKEEVGLDGHTWRWAQSQAQVTFENRTDHDIQVQIKSSIAAWYTPQCNVTLHGVVDENIRCNASPVPWDRIVTVAPGKHVLTFDSDAPIVELPGGARELRFRLLDFNASAAR